MKALVFGASGFIGQHVSEALRNEGHDVTGTYRQAGDRPGLSVDLADAEAVGLALETVHPEIVINCAGIVQNNETAEANVLYSGNILSQVVAKQLDLQRFVMLGSAAEYGVVEADEFPVKESTPLRATNPYGLSKVKEVALALSYCQEQNLPVVVARVFNPVGPGMPSQQLLPRLLGQIEEIRAGRRQALEVNRTDAGRDFIDIRDLARAIVLLATGSPQYDVYNIGSGQETSIKELAELLAEASLLPSLQLQQTGDQPEPRVASRADISRLRAMGWEPQIPLSKTVKDIIDDPR